MVTENLKKVEKKIESACTRAGRDRNDVTLIAVSKDKTARNDERGHAVWHRYFW